MFMESGIKGQGYFGANSFDIHEYKKSLMSLYTMYFIKQLSRDFTKKKLYQTIVSFNCMSMSFLK